MTQELLRRVHLELLDVLKAVNELEPHHDGDHFYELLRDVEAALADQDREDTLLEKIEQDFHLHDEDNEGGWTDWICPKPDSYLMKCCDCGLVHEMQTRIADYEPRPSEDFVVSNNPDLQAQFRVRRHEVFDTTPQRTEERNFCSRCGKRTLDMTHIHTCTPPRRTRVGMTVDELITLEQKHMRHEDLSRAIEAKLKQKNGYAKEKNT